MFDLSSPSTVNHMIGMTPGSVAVAYRGVTGSGHPGLPPGMVFDGPEVTVGQPAVVVAAGHFPDIGLCEVQGIQNVRGSLITVGDYVWMISGLHRASEDGAEVLLMLTDPD